MLQAGSYNIKIKLNLLRFQFLSKRYLTSGAPSINYMKEHDRIVNQVNTPLKTTDCSNYLCRLNLASVKLSSVKDKEMLKPGLILIQSDSNRDVYLSNNCLLSLPPHSAFSEYEKRMIYLSESANGPTPEPQDSGSGRPSEEQLHHVFDVLSKTVSSL